MPSPTKILVVAITSIRSFELFDTGGAFCRQGGGPSRSVSLSVFAIHQVAIRQSPIHMSAAVTVVLLAFVCAQPLLRRRSVERAGPMRERSSRQPAEWKRPPPPLGRVWVGVVAIPRRNIR